jgi:23S rRNA (uridine2552-2'-O)-methyltransferase
MKTKASSKKVNKAWLHDHINDPYVKLAKREGYRARAAYKLKEIDETLGLIKPGSSGGGPGLHTRCLEPVCAPAPVTYRARR